LFYTTGLLLNIRGSLFFITNFSLPDHQGITQAISSKSAHKQAHF